MCVCVLQGIQIENTFGLASPPLSLLSLSLIPLSLSLPPLPGPFSLHEPKSLHHFQEGSPATCLQPFPNHGLATPPSHAGVWNSEHGEEVEGEGEGEFSRLCIV